VKIGPGLSVKKGEIRCNSASDEDFGCLSPNDFENFSNKVDEDDLEDSESLADLVGDGTGSGALVFGDGATMSALTLSGVGTSILLATNESGVVIGTSSITVQALSVLGNATTTFQHGINLATGCFAVNGVCLTGGGGGGGITDLNGLIASSQSFATSSDPNIRIAITSSGSTHTFTPSWNGVLAVSRGGTGTSTAPGVGQILIGNGSGYDLVSTSSLGLGTGNGAVNSGTVGQVPYYASNGSTLTATSALFISSDAAVGIGTTTPLSGYSLTTQDSISIGGLSSGNDDWLRIHAPNGGRLTDIGYSSGVFGIRPSIGNQSFVIGSAAVNDMSFVSSSAGGGVIRFNTTSGEALRMTSNGSIGIGTTSPHARLSIDASNLGTTSAFAIGSSTSSYFTVTNTGNVGIGTTAPSAQLAVASSSSFGGLATFGSGINVNGETITDLSGTNLTVSSGALALSAALTGITSINRASLGLTIMDQSFSISGSAVTMAGGTYTQANGSFNGLVIAPVYNQTGTSSATDFLINRTETTVGTGPQYLADFRVGGVSRFNVTNTGYVGIGSTSPNAQLSIDASNLGTTSAFSIGSSTGSFFVVTNTGSVGIGTTSPAATLGVNGTGLFSGGVTTFGNMNILNAGNLVIGGTALSRAGNDLRVNATSVNGGVFTFSGGDSTTAKTSLLANGNFGIGTSSPHARLAIETSSLGTTSALLVGSTTNTNFIVTNNGLVGIGKSNLNTADALTVLGGGIALRESDDGNYALRLAAGAATGALNMYNNGTINTVIQSSNSSPTYFNAGNVGVGTSSPFARFSVQETMGGASTSTIFAIASSSASGIGTTTLLSLLGSGNLGLGTTTPSAQLTTTGTVRFATFGAGSLQTDANGNVSVSSDERLKNVEATFTRGTEAIMGIEPITYRWKQETGYDTENPYTGFSAQNIQEFIPEAVGENKAGFLTLSDRPILATLVNAVKEIVARMDALADRVRTKEVQTDTLCVGQTCVNEAQLIRLLENANETPIPVPTTPTEPPLQEPPAGDETVTTPTNVPPAPEPTPEPSVVIESTPQPEVPPPAETQTTE
jgi:hypothetical protein